MKILVYGAINIDLIFSVDHIAMPGETVSAGDFKRGPGGKGSNQAAALAKAGVPVYLAGKIGHDGEFLLELLRSYKVDTSLVTIYEGATGNALIQVDKNGQNAIVPYAGGNGAITVEEVNKVLGNFGKDDIVILQNEIVHAAEIIAEAKKRGLKVCFNPSPYDEKISSVPLDLVDTFFVNELEGAALAAEGGTGGADKNAPFPVILEKLVTKFPHAEIILTAGKEGAFYGFKNERAKGDIVDIPVVDTTGAGDTFSGYFIAARARGIDVNEALRLACKASSIAVSRPGAMEAVPFASEVF
ncbi:ribokinase [Leadbettera azotonutricia]|uniref:Ribokinase n=1 Tax=Leadbettera azotonutricia (strain ATCC BAA-888 / DSM 13862 / ZAS-9) TaxID=545695 RepID=F5YDX5_LEAAZ|nr:ribokinase [Leadbettera azotonutricia]AEF80495.1 PfkB [Leadbettera azotonutricia ZAS-9]